MHRILLGFLGCLLLLSACKEESGPIFVRVINGSDATYDQVAFGGPEGESFGALTPGDTSRYQQSPHRYETEYFMVQIGSDTILSDCMLVDKSPPLPLAPGYYTYEITLFEAGTQLLYNARRVP